MTGPHESRMFAKVVSRFLIACMAVAMVAGAGCKAKRVITLRLSSTHINLLYYSRGRVVFEPIEGTTFRKTGGGEWAGGDVTYSVNDEGQFEIVMDGNWMREEVLRNREGDYPGAYVILIPLTGIEDEGTFDVRAEYAYNDEDDGTGWRVIAEGSLYPALELPLSGDDDFVGIVMQCTDRQGEACTMTHPDPDGVEIPDVPDIADVPDGTTDPDVPDATVDPEAEDTSSDPDPPEDVPEALEDPAEDEVAGDPPEDPEPDDSGD